MQKFKITTDPPGAGEAYARSEKAAYAKAHEWLRIGADVRVWIAGDGRADEAGRYWPYEDLSAADFTD